MSDADVKIQDLRFIPYEVQIIQKLQALGWSMAAAWFMATEVYPLREERGLEAWFAAVLDDE